MNKKKKVVFVLLMCVCIASIVYPYVVDLFTHKDQNALQQVKLKSGEYKVGKDFPEGQYDILSATDNAMFMQKNMSKNDKWIGLSFNEGEMIPVKGSFLLMPSSSKKLKTEANGGFEILNSGYYEIGHQIPAGKYTLTFEQQESIFEKPFIQILSKDRSIIKGYSFKKTKIYQIELKKEEILEIHKSLFKENKAEVLLNPM